MLTVYRKDWRSEFRLRKLMTRRAATFNGKTGNFSGVVTQVTIKNATKRKEM
jgi:hypothetical protein